MKAMDPRYKDQWISVDAATFTIIDGEIKVLLIKRSEEPYKGLWSLPGGGVYNNESTEDAVTRELKEKIGLDKIILKQFAVFSDPKRDIRYRNISICYLALIDSKKYHILKNSSKATEICWMNLNDIPNLAFDHNKILDASIDSLKETLTKSDIVKNIMPDTFTIQELQNVYEIIFKCKFDERNFRRKFVNLGLIYQTGEQKQTDRYRRPNLYKFNEKLPTDQISFI